MHLDLLFLLTAFLLSAAGHLLFPGYPFLLPLGAICLFFAPGYLLLAALYPDQRSLPPPQRFLGAFGLSVVVSSLLLLLVAYTTGFTTRSAFIALCAWALPLSLLTALRRRQIHPPHPAFPIMRLFRSARGAPSPSAIRHSPLPSSALRCRSLATSFVTAPKQRSERRSEQRSPLPSPLPLPGSPALYPLSLIVLFSIAHLIASASTPQFTEFYILGPDGLLGDLSERLQPGATPEIFLGIANHEGRPVVYQVRIQVSGLSARPLMTLTLQNGGSWEEIIALPRPPDPDRRKLTLTLHKDTDPVPYRSVYLWLNGAHSKTATTLPSASTFLAKKPAIPDPAAPAPDVDPAPPRLAGPLPRWLTNAAMAVLTALLAIKELANAFQDPRYHRLSRRLNLPILPLFILFALIIFTRLAAALR